MAIRDTWRRSLEYFGLVEGDYIEEGAYADEGDTGQEMALDSTQVAPREEAPARTLRGGRRSRDTGEIDDLWGDDEGGGRRGGRLRAVDDEPAPRRMRNGGGSGDFSMHVVTPRSFNDAQSIADEFKRQKPVIINLQSTDRELSKRLIDFASGMTYALGGGMQRVSQGIFLLTPANVEVSAEEKAKILEGGFFNQS